MAQRPLQPRHHGAGARGCPQLGFRGRKWGRPGGASTQQVFWEAVPGASGGVPGSRGQRGAAPGRTLAPCLSFPHPHMAPRAGGGSDPRPWGSTRAPLASWGGGLLLTTSTLGRSGGALDKLGVPGQGCPQTGGQEGIWGTPPSPPCSAPPALTLPEAGVDVVAGAQPVGGGPAAQLHQLVQPQLPAVDGGGLGLQRDQQLLRALRGHQPGLRGARGVTTGTGYRDRDGIS